MLDPARLMFIDETAVSTNMVRLRGRAPRGVRVIGAVPLGRWETITFVAALRHNKMVAPHYAASPSSVKAQIQANDLIQSIKAHWLIGCDGMHSTVREKSGITFSGGEYDASFVLADVSMDWPLSCEEVTLFYSPKGLVVVAPLPNERFRIVATVDEAPEVPSLEFMQAILDARGPSTNPGRLHDVAWSSRFHIHHRVAQTPRKGRVLLCGDAAHVHSPAGGQGMNTGIQDSISLADALSKTLHDGDGGRLMLGRPNAARWRATW